MVRSGGLGNSVFSLLLYIGETICGQVKLWVLPKDTQRNSLNTQCLSLLDGESTFQFVQYDQS